MRRIIVPVILCLVASACTEADSGVTTSAPSTLPTSTTSLGTTTTTTAPTTTSTTWPGTNPLFDAGPLAGRSGHSVVWTGSEMIVWGGWGDEEGRVQFSDGAAFDPGTGTWRMISQSPLGGRAQHLATWTGEEMLVFGGGPDAAAYDPASDTWFEIAAPPVDIPNGEVGYLSQVWTGESVVVWKSDTDDVVAYQPERDRWSDLPGTGFESHHGVLRWSGEHVYAFAAPGDFPSFGPLEVKRLEGGEWADLAGVELQEGDVHDPGLVVWDGRRFLTYGRDSSATMAYDPSSDEWVGVAEVTIAPCEGLPAPVNAGDLVYAPSFCGDNSVYDSATDNWTVTAISGFGDARYTVWTGEELLTWGDPCCFGTGGVTPFEVTAWRYDLDTQARRVCEVGHEMTIQGDLISETELTGGIWALGQGIEPDSVTIRSNPTILFKVPGDPVFTSRSPTGRQVEPALVEARPASSWGRPGNEWLTVWDVDESGCWTIEISTSTGAAAELIIEVNPG